MGDEAFKKINLTPEAGGATVSPSGNTTMPKKRSKLKKPLSVGLLALLGIVLVLAIAIIFPARTLVAKARETEVAGKELSAALKTQDLVLAKEKLTVTKQKLADTDKAAGMLGWTGFIPFFGYYYHDMDHGLVAAKAGLEALEISIDAVGPYADILGLKGEGTFTGGTADQRLQTAIATFDKVTPRLADISEKVQIVQKEIDEIDPNRYPDSFQGKEIRPNIVQAKALIDEMSKLFVSARPLLEQLPTIMGANEEKKYLVLFKNDKELRPDGGFLTAYAIFKMEGGKPVVERADDIYKLDDSRTEKVSAPPEILKYHKGVYEFNLRDSNISPDFATSVKNFEQLYASVPGKIDYDGIITVDTHVLVEAMKILGEFNIYDRKFSAENDPRCDCPRVVYELEDYSSRPVAYVRSDRKDIIGVLLLEVMQKALGVSPGQYWGQLFQMGISELNQKHILMNLNDEKAQTSIEALGWGGRIVPFEGDYLHINDANMAGAKSDLFVQRSALVEYKKEDGKITKTVTIKYKNPAKASNCNLEAGQLCLNGLLRDWLRVYVPKGSKLVDFKGSEMDPVVKEDLGKTVLEGFVTVKPLGASQAIVTYTLPDGLEKDGVLPVLIQKQPGTEGNEYEIKVNGRTVEKFKLLTDKVLELKI